MCGIHAQAFGAAEFRHGPIALVDEGLPVLALAPDGPSREVMFDLAAEVAPRGGRVLVAAPDAAPALEGVPGTVALPLAPNHADELAPILAAQTAYRFVERLARELGRDPDRPPHLEKVTRTR